MKFSEPNHGGLRKPCDTGYKIVTLERASAGLDRLPLGLRSTLPTTQPRQHQHHGESMSQKADYLQLEPTDDVTSVRDRLSFMRGNRVLMIWPEDGTVLTRKLDLVLIQREAMRRNIRLAIVTHDPEVMKQAGELNISTFETVGAAERGRWKRGRAKVFSEREDKPAETPKAEAREAVRAETPRPARAEKAEKVIQPRIRKAAADETDDEPRRRGPRLGLVLLLLFLILVAAGVAVLVVPQAVVTITPARAQVPAQVEITANPQATDVDIDSRTVPALTLRVEVEDSGTLPTSGSESRSDILASGSVVFINQTNAEVTIPAGTEISTSAGTPILFRTTTDALAPAQLGGQIEVPIEAQTISGGRIGNVDSGLINSIIGPLSESLTVRNLQATTGGESRNASVVAQEDYDRLLATLRQQLQAVAYQAMEQQISPSQTIILETIRLAGAENETMTWSAEVGEEASTLTLTMRTTVEATVIDEVLAQQIAFSSLTAQIPPGRALVPGAVNYQCCTVSAIQPDGSVTFTMTGEALVAGQVNTAQLQERLIGRTPEDAIRYLLSEVDLAPETTPQVSVSPEWFGRLPFLPMQITVRLADAPA